MYADPRPLQRYKNIMNAYHSGVHFGNIKADYNLPFFLGMLQESLRIGDYEEAANSLDDIVTCYDMSNSKIKYMTNDILEECEKYVDEIMQKQKL